MYGHLLSAAWILVHHWTRLASSFAGDCPLLCCTIGSLQVDADVSVLCQCKDVWCVSGFHGDGFWLSVPIYVGHLGQLMLFLLLSRFGFSDEVPGCSDLELLMCPCCAADKWLAQQILTLKWRHLNAVGFNVIQCAKFHCKVKLFLYLKWRWKFEVNYIISHVAFLFWRA